MVMEALCLQYVPEAASKLSQRHGSSKVRGRWLLSVGPTNSKGKGLVSCRKAAIASPSSQYPLTKLENSEGILSVGQRGEFGTALRTRYVSVREGHIQCCTASSESSLSSDLPSSSSSSTAKSSSSTELPLPSSTPTGRRRPPVFVLNEKPDRNLQQLENLSSRQRSKKTLQDSLGDDDGSTPTTTNANHRSGYVALIGRPNVGKSTLMNQIIGQKLSIVTNKPQTTRHRILGICSTPDYQMILYDTPGMIVKRLNKLDEMMMQNVRTAALNADCVLVIVDATETPKTVIESLEEGALKIVQSRPSLLVMNKKDRIKPGEIAKKVQWYEQHSGLNEVHPVSAKYGQGISELKGWLVSKLPLGPAYYPKENISDQPEKFFASEIIREKIFLQYMKEIPYVSQVNVTSYVERTPPAKDYIVVDIIVERETQKAIVIGKEGSALKTLATAARLDIEDFIGREVFLEIKVKVKEDWRANENLLKYYGYSGQIA